VLATNLTCPGDDPAIRITADNVTLNLNGRTLTGDGGDGGGDGVLAEGTEGNPTVEGLQVVNAPSETSTTASRSATPPAPGSPA
jgi:hypothetical protein